MDDYIGNIIDDDIKSGREKRAKYNVSRNIIRKQKSNVDNYVSDISGTSMYDTEAMDVDETCIENIHYQFASKTSGYSSINKTNSGEPFCKDNEGIDDNYTDSNSEYDAEGDCSSISDDDFNLLDAYKSLTNSDTSEASDDEQDQHFDLGTNDERLHSYTNMKTFDVCKQFIHLIRDSQVSKSQTEKFLRFIKNILPTPNSFPNTMKDLLAKVEVKTCFEKRVMCSLCGRQLNMKKQKCTSCVNFEKKNLVFIYDTHFADILSSVVTRLSNDIKVYKERIYANDYTSNDGTFDIPFASTYQELLKTHKKNFISLLLHLDGIGLCKSTKLKMWMFSSSIIELPPKIRYRRQNMPLISVWVSCTEPKISMWLSECILKLKLLKTNGMFISLFMLESEPELSECSTNN